MTGQSSSYASYVLLHSTMGPPLHERGAPLSTSPLHKRGATREEPRERGLLSSPYHFMREEPRERSLERGGSSLHPTISRERSLERGGSYLHLTTSREGGSSLSSRERGFLSPPHHFTRGGLLSHFTREGAPLSSPLHPSAITYHFVPLLSALLSSIISGANERER